MSKRHLVEGRDRWNNLFFSISSAISWVEFPESPGRLYFKLNRKLSSVLNKLLSDRLSRHSFITKSNDFFQEEDMIIHEPKRKRKDVNKYWENRELTEAATPWRPKTTSHNNNGRAFGLKQRALDLFFDKCEALISRLTVIFFFRKKNCTYLKFTWYW